VDSKLFNRMRKASNPCEFGAKVLIAVMAKDGWVVGARTFKGNPYDGHTLFEVFDQIKAITDHTPKQVYVDRGYCSAYLGQKTDVIITGQKRHNRATKRWMKRRNSVEPIIGHLKGGHKMQRNWLKGHLGDIMAPVLADFYAITENVTPQQGQVYRLLSA
jgi:hypothetical protein